MMKRSFLLSLLALTALSACKEEATLTKTPRDPALVLDGEKVNPVCFVYNMSEDDQKTMYLTKNCATDELKLDLKTEKPLGPDFVSVKYYYQHTRLHGFIGYRYIGDYKGLKVIQLVENSGGSGVLTSLMLLRLNEKGELHLEQALAGGDRCNGGIADAFMADDKLVYDVSLTPFDFFTLTEKNPNNLQPYEDIAACASCCYGVLRYVNGEPSTVMLNADAMEHMQGAQDGTQTPQSCFDQTFATQVKSGKTTLTIKETGDFVTDFNKTCLAP